MPNATQFTAGWILFSESLNNRIVNPVVLALMGALCPIPFLHPQYPARSVSVSITTSGAINILYGCEITLDHGYIALGCDEVDGRIEASAALSAAHVGVPHHAGGLHDDLPLAGGVTATPRARDPHARTPPFGQCSEIARAP